MPRPVDGVAIETDLDTRRKIKVLASLEAQTMREWLKWMVDMAYKSQVRSRRK